MNDIIEHIKSLVDTYESSSASYNITELMQIQDELSAYRFRLSELVADSKGDYLRAYFNRKMDVSRTAKTLSQTMAVNKATIQSELEHADAFEKEIDAEQLAFKCEIMFKASGDVLRAMSQRISHLKNEWHEQNA